MSRINFTVFGAKNLKVPAYAAGDTTFESAGGLAAAALARKNGLHVVNVRASHQDGEKRTTYDVTLGTPTPGGGYTPQWSGQIMVESR
jgi:hypothetical protein